MVVCLAEAGVVGGLSRDEARRDCGAAERGDPKVKEWNGKRPATKRRRRQNMIWLSGESQAGEKEDGGVRLLSEEGCGVESSRASRSSRTAGSLCVDSRESVSLSLSLSSLGQCHVPVRAACSEPALVSIVMLGGKRVGGKGGKLQEGRGEGEKARKCVKEENWNWLVGERKEAQGWARGRT